MAHLSGVLDQVAGVGVVYLLRACPRDKQVWARVFARTCLQLSKSQASGYTYSRRKVLARATLSVLVKCTH